MMVNIIRSGIKALLNFIFNEWLIKKFVLFYKVLLEDKVRNAVGDASLSLVERQGANCKFHGDVKVYYSEGMVLHDDIRVGYGCFFFALGGITIGNNTQISRNVVIYSANHNTQGNAIPYDDSYILKPVIIGKSVWIGMNVLILPGVKIGDGAIIGMGAVISKDVEPGEVVVGSQQRTVKTRDLKAFYELDESNQHFGKMWPQK